MEENQIENEVVLKCAIIMVGLPARGKTYMSRKLARYLNWIGLEAKAFNVGDLRRKQAPNSINNAEFFSKDNKDAMHLRNLCAFKLLDDMADWMKSTGPSIGIYDATNTTKNRRKEIYKHLSSIPGLHVLFVESICTDPDVIEANIKEVKVSSPDYQDVDKEEAILDFKKRIKYYESIYEPIDINGDRDIPFLKIFNLGSKFIANQINNHMQSRIIYYYMNIRVLPRVIYITRPGERIYDVKNLLGDDKELSEGGIQYSKALGKYIEEHKEMEDVVVWTSVMASDNATTNLLKPTVKNVTKLKSLNELDAGDFEKLTYDEIQCRFPEEYSLREADKYYYRFPAGESYQDLVVRLEPIIMEIEKVTNVLVVCQQAVARCLISYLTDKPREDTPYMDIPLHTVFKLTPVAYGCKMEKINFGIAAVNNYRPKPAGLVSSKSFDESRLRRKLSVTNISCIEPLSVSPPIITDANVEKEKHNFI